jgi:hypothetical protein
VVYFFFDTDYYGSSASVNGDYAVVGSYYDDGGAGAAYVITIP